MKLEVVVIPVSDVDRAKRFYGDLGWRLDGDFVVGSEFRGIQFTPPGSPCSIHFGKGHHVGRAGLGTRSVSHRVRHRGGARRARWSPCRRERSVPSCRPGQAACQRPRSREAQLQLVRHVQRPGWQQLVAAGGQDATSRTGTQQHGRPDSDRPFAGDRGAPWRVRSRPRRSTTGRGGTQRTSLRASAAGLPRRQPRMLRSTWKVPDEAGHRSRRSLS